MFRSGHSVAFAALLLVAQLLFGVLAADTGAHSAAQHCDDSRGAATSHVAHGGGAAADYAVPDCTHCPDDGAPVAGCAYFGGNHCGSGVTLAFVADASPRAVVLRSPFGEDPRAVALPDSPIFDLLRPPTRAA